eukprot:SAG11_NODE_1104_length_5859_cov_4.321528_2_plen_47_part_00
MWSPTWTCRFLIVQVYKLKLERVGNDLMVATIASRLATACGADCSM